MSDFGVHTPPDGPLRDSRPWPSDQEAEDLLVAIAVQRDMKRTRIVRCTPREAQDVASWDAQVAALAPALAANLEDHDVALMRCRHAGTSLLWEGVSRVDALRDAFRRAQRSLQASFRGWTRGLFQAWLDLRSNPARPTARGCWLVFGRVAERFGTPSPSPESFALLAALAGPHSWPSLSGPLPDGAWGLRADVDWLDQDWLLATLDLCPGGAGCACASDATPPRACACRVAVAVETSADADLGRGRVLGVRRVVPCPHQEASGNRGEPTGARGAMSGGHAPGDGAALDQVFYDALWLNHGIAVLGMPGLRVPGRVLLAQEPSAAMERACAELRTPTQRVATCATGPIAASLGEVTGLGPGWGQGLAGRRLAGNRLDEFLGRTLERQCGLDPVEARERAMSGEQASPDPVIRAHGRDLAYVCAAAQHLVPAVAGRVLPDGRVRCGELCFAEQVERPDATFRVLPWWAGEDVAVRPWCTAPAYAYIYVADERIAYVAVDRTVW